MQIRLNGLAVENFKGLKNFEMKVDGSDMLITGENASGKTTVYDAFLWLLFGKDSSGRKDFELRPLDKQNQPIKGLVLSVEGEIDVDGRCHILCKEHHEKVVKKQLRGYETLCWIDEVPKKVSEYSEYITSIIPEDTFKLLTDLYFFNSKMHWTDRRAILLDVAGEIGSPEGFDELLAALNGRTVDEYKQVLAEQKKRLSKERDEINPRIDEIQRALDDYAGEDVTGLDKQRKALKKEIVDLDAKRNKLLAEENERQKQIEYLNDLNARKARREAELANDTSSVRSLLDEKAKIADEVLAKMGECALVENQIELTKSTLESKKAEFQSHLRALQATRAEYESLHGSPMADTCKLCGQRLPAEKVKDVEEKRKADLQALTKQGNDQKKAVTNCKDEVERLEAMLKERNESFQKLKDECRAANAAAEKRLTEIDAAVNENKGLAPETDERWNGLCAEIAETGKKIGDPVSSQLEGIEGQRAAKLDRMTQLDKALAQSDQAAKNKARIAELEAGEMKLAQSITDVERQLDNIDEYKANESRLVEEAVNGKFKHVEFKLFNQLLNGSLEECCEAILDGVPYSDMSYGQRIIAGVDIITVLSEHFGLSVPLFIDNSESLTLPIEATTQTIQLQAQKNVKKLTVEKKGVAHA